MTNKCIYNVYTLYIQLGGVMAPKTPQKHREKMREYYIKHRLKLLAAAKKRQEVRTSVEIRKRKKYARWQSLVRRYGITESDYNKILLLQRGTCALCDKIPSDERNGVLNVDHDHTKKNVRGLLCSQCNLALGHLGDTPRSLLRAFLYVVNHALY